MIKQWFASTVFILAIVSPMLVWAESSNALSRPEIEIQTVTDKLLRLIHEHEKTFETEPDPFFMALDELMQDVVDFKFIARKVMGGYEKSASQEQLDRFESVFRDDLIKTYGRGLFLYGNQKVVLLPLEGDIAGKRSVTVNQEIHNDGKVYPLSYSMGLNREGQWKIINLVINGINLGKTFRNQFLQKAREYDGDVDKVLENWTSEVSV